MSVTLHQIAPWNDRLRNPYRTRWAQVGDHRYKVSAEWLNGMWTVEQVNEDGDWMPYGAEATVAMVFNLDEARAAIEAHAAGKTRDEIDAAVSAVPRRRRRSGRTW